MMKSYFLIGTAPRYRSRRFGGDLYGANMGRLPVYSVALGQASISLVLSFPNIDRIFQQKMLK